MNSDAYAEKLKLLSGLAMLLQSCEKEKELFDVTYWYLPKLFPATSGNIFLVDKTGQYCTPVFLWPSREAPEAVPDPTGCPAITTGNAVDENDPRRSQCLSCRCGTYCISFREGRQAVGVFCLETEQDLPLSSPDRGLTLITAEYLSLAIANIRLKHRLKEMSIRDPLTQLYNRRYMDDVTVREMKKAKRSGSTLGMIMVDLDYFKKFNDTHGHQAGDHILRYVADILVSGLRAEDMVCRFGGEEFFILINGDSYDNYMNRARDLHNAIKAEAIPWKDGTIGPVTASLGVAVFPDDGQTFDTMLKIADRALYEAKNQGRDRVVSAMELTNYEKLPDRRAGYKS